MIPFIGLLGAKSKEIDEQTLSKLRDLEQLLKARGTTVGTDRPRLSVSPNRPPSGASPRRSPIGSGGVERPRVSVSPSLPPVGGGPRLALSPNRSRTSSFDRSRVSMSPNMPPSDRPRVSMAPTRPPRSSSGGKRSAAPHLSLPPSSPTFRASTDAPSSPAGTRRGGGVFADRNQALSHALDSPDASPGSAPHSAPGAHTATATVAGKDADGAGKDAEQERSEWQSDVAKTSEATRCV